MSPFVIFLIVIEIFSVIPLLILLFDLWVYAMFNFHPAPFTENQFGVVVIFLFFAIGLAPALSMYIDDYRTKKILGGKK